MKIRRGDRVTFRDVTETLSGTVLDTRHVTADHGLGITIYGTCCQVSSCRGTMWIQKGDIIRVEEKYVRKMPALRR